MKAAAGIHPIGINYSSFPDAIRLVKNYFFKEVVYGFMLGQNNLKRRILKRLKAFTKATILVNLKFL